MKAIKKEMKIIALCLIVNCELFHDDIRSFHALKESNIPLCSSVVVV